MPSTNFTQRELLSRQLRMLRGYDPGQKKLGAGHSRGGRERPPARLSLLLGRLRPLRRLAIRNSVQLHRLTDERRSAAAVDRKSFGTTVPRPRIWWTSEVRKQFPYPPLYMTMYAPENVSGFPCTSGDSGIINRMQTLAVIENRDR